MLEENETVKNYLYLAANDDTKTKESEFCTLQLLSRPRSERLNYFSITDE